MRLAAPGCLAETCTDSPSNIWIENSSRNSNKSLLGRNYFSMRFKGAESRIDLLMFQGVKVALDRCIVIGAACSAHALLDEQSFARANKFLRSKLTTLIAVKDEAFSWFMSGLLINS